MAKPSRARTTRSEWEARRGERSVEEEPNAVAVPNSAGPLAQQVLRVREHAGNVAAGRLIARAPLTREAAAADPEATQDGDTTATADRAVMTLSDGGAFGAFALRFSGPMTVSAEKRGDEHSERLFRLFKERTRIEWVIIEIEQGESAATYRLSDAVLTAFHISGSFGDRGSTESFTLEAKRFQRAS